MCGADGWVAIETYGKAKEEWLKSFLELPNGIPSHDTFGRIFSRLDPEILESNFQLLLEQLDLKGAIITTDAMGTQTAIAQQIQEAGADYILAIA